MRSSQVQTSRVLQRGCSYIPLCPTKPHREETPGGFRGG